MSEAKTGSFVFSTLKIMKLRGYPKDAILGKSSFAYFSMKKSRLPTGKTNTQKEHRNIQFTPQNRNTTK